MRTCGPLHPMQLTDSITIVLMDHTLIPSNGNYVRACFSTRLPLFRDRSVASSSRRCLRCRRFRLDCRDWKLSRTVVDFTNFCPIRQQLMSNFLCAMRFSPLPGHRSTASADILAAIPPDAAPTTEDSSEQRLQEGRIVDLAGLVRIPAKPDSRSGQGGQPLREAT